MIRVQIRRPAHPSPVEPDTRTPGGRRLPWALDSVDWTELGETFLQAARETADA